MRIFARRTRFAAASVAALLGSLPASAQAHPWMIFSGVVTGVTDFGAGVSPVGVGQRIVGSINVIGFVAGVDGDPDPQLGVYDDHITGARIILGSAENFTLTQNFLTDVPTNRIRIDDGFTTAGEDAVGYAYVADVSVLGIGELAFEGTDPSGLAWYSDDLVEYLFPGFWTHEYPGSSSSFFDDSTLTLLVRTGPTDGFEIQSTVGIFSNVPEPSAAVLIGCGLLALGLQNARYPTSVLPRVHSSLSVSGGL
jgi:hypothetical protein